MQTRQHCLPMTGPNIKKRKKKIHVVDLNSGIKDCLMLYCCCNGMVRPHYRVMIKCVSFSLVARIIYH